MTRAPSIKVARASACSIGVSRSPAKRRLKRTLQTRVRATGLLLLFAMVVNAAPLDLSAWKYRKRIPLTPGEQLAVVRLDREVYMGSASDLSDLRVMRDGAEVPFEVGFLEPGADAAPGHAERILDLSVVDGSNLEFTVHVPFAKKNRIQLDVAEQNFRQRVSIEASNDNEHWAMLRSDGAIFDFTKDGRKFSSLDVAFPVSTKRFLRVTIFGWKKTSAIRNVYVNYELRAPAARETLATITPSWTQDSDARTTVATIDLGVAGLPIDRLVLNIQSAQFQRAASVEVSSNGHDWSNVAQGVVARLPAPDFTEESLALTLPETHSRYLRVRIYNRDDQPLQLGPVQAEGLIRHIKFLAAAAGEYWLYFGNTAPAPQYDLPALLARRKNVEANWTLGPLEANPAYHAPAPPWTERHPAILYTMLGGAVLALGIATLRFAVRLRS